MCPNNHRRTYHLSSVCVSCTVLLYVHLFSHVLSSLVSVHSCISTTIIEYDSNSLPYYFIMSTLLCS